MACNCGGTKTESLLLRKSPSTTSVSTTGSTKSSESISKSCPKCRTYRTKRSNNVVRCPICQTVFSAS